MGFVCDRVIPFPEGFPALPGPEPPHEGPILSGTILISISLAQTVGGAAGARGEPCAQAGLPVGTAGITAVILLIQGFLNRRNLA